MRKHKHRKNFFIHIILPSLLAFCLFTLTIFVLIIPAMRDNMMQDKRRLIKELTTSTISILDKYYSLVEENELSEIDAKSKSVELIESLRYGEEQKDYFWITDMHPVMIMHPYRKELNNTDVSNYTDPKGKKLFSEFIVLVAKNNEGFTDYMWQWKDDSTKIVPKLSYVKRFEPWDWVVGTGVYIEDVNNEIAKITKRSMYILLAILIVLGIILTYIGRQSFKIERNRQTTLKKLGDSEEKYRLLVEASTEGLILVLDGKFVFVNKALMKMLGYENSKISNTKIFFDRELSETSGSKYLKRLKDENIFIDKAEADLMKMDGSLIDVVLFTSEINFGSKNGYTVIVKDISRHKQIELELGENKTKYQSLIDNAMIGLFRVSFADNKFIVSNNSTANILGFQNSDEIIGTSFEDYFEIGKEWNYFHQKLLTEKQISNYVVQIKKKNSPVIFVSISALITADKNENEETNCDGIIEDITERLRISEERENQLIELQTSLRFLNEPVVNYVKNMISCNMNTPTAKAAQLMTRNKYSASLLYTDDCKYVGIITDHDLRERAVAENINLEKPVYEIMSSPIVYLQANAPVFQAMLYMKDKGIRHLAVRDNLGNVLGMISSEELIKVQRHSSSYLVHEINSADSIEELFFIKDKLKIFYRTLTESGAKPKNISQVLTTVFDSITTKLIKFAADKLGEPPAKFAFIALGSIGRKEQTYISDQDNAIIYEDISENNDGEIVSEYFNELAGVVCNWLNECGYPFCKGNAMAKNPAWCQRLSKWKEYFHSWIVNSKPQDLIDLSIFFDFRLVAGEQNLTEELREYLFETAEGQAGFMYHLAQNCLQHKVPVGIMGKIVVETKGDFPETFDIKPATLPIIDYARIYALKNKINNTNTLERLNALWLKKVISKKSYDEIVQAYNFLMQLRFSHHSDQLHNNKEPNNHFDPAMLTNIELNTLKNSFSQIVSIQKKLSYDFSGDAI